MILADKKLAFFLTKGMSLMKWQKMGTIKRELAPYNFLAGYFQKIYIITYGCNEELAFQSDLNDNMEILCKNTNMPDFFYQFLVYFKFRNKLNQCDFYKTNQINGSVAALIGKIFNWRGKLIIRSGYSESLNGKLYRKNFLWRVYVTILEAIIYLIGNLAVVTTIPIKEYLIKRYFYLKNKIVVIPNGINIDIFRPIDISREYDIGYVGGRLDKDKNLLNLLRAAVDTEWRICFIGRGREKEELQKFAQENNIQLSIIDPVPNYQLPNWYNKFKIFVFPSLHEGNPKVLLEAMACGRPVIGCDVVGVNNIITNNCTGLISGTDGESLKKSINVLLDNKILAEQLSIQARDYIKRNYSLGDILSQELEIYQNIS